MSDPRIGQPPERPCWHKRIRPDGTCVDCGALAAVRIPDRTTSPPESSGLLLSVNPPIRSILYLTNGVVRIESHRCVPNAWIRFWHRALLGWRWEAKEP
jgi:hypothetical protein